MTVQDCKHGSFASEADLGSLHIYTLSVFPQGSMANIVVELHDRSVNPMELSSGPAKTAAQVLNACARRFHKGVGTLSPKDKPNFALEAEDTVAGGVTYIFIPSAGIQGLNQGASWIPFSIKLFPQHL